MGPSMVADVVRPPGPWTTSGPLSRGCSQQDLIRPVLFVTKCHTENSSQISHLCRLFFWQYSFSRHLKFMTTGEDWNKDRFKNWKLCGLWKLPFRQHGAINLTQNWVCFTNPCINLCSDFVTREYPNYLNISTCCNVFPLTCRIHCPGRLERHNASIFLVLIFVPVWSAAVENRSNACWKPCWEDPRMQCQIPIRPQKANGSFCSSQQWLPRRRVCGCLSNSYRPGLSRFLGKDSIGYCTTVRGPTFCAMWYFRGILHST